MAGMTIHHSGSFARGTSTKSPLTAPDSQVELFRLFGALFTALIGTGVASISEVDEIFSRYETRYKDEYESLALEFNAAAGELEDFYRNNAAVLYGHARALGGVKLVTGGQRTFGPSALDAVRITGLYADTQLIPDPIYPYVTGDMRLNALHFQMAQALFYVLQLRPLVDARLPVPPLFIFPSFELELEAGDAITLQGISELALRIIAPVCDGTFASLEELMDYAYKHEDRFVNSIMAERLFVPQGSSPTERMTGSEALKRYFSSLEGVRDAKLVSQMRKLPSGVLILNGVIERLGPQYHLYENGAELNAQPLLSQAVHWHYYEKCALSSAETLVKQQILSEQSFQTLRALQDDSVRWLATIPVEGLVELTRNQEQKVFRKELKEYTSQLASAGPAELNQVVCEVNHALADLFQRQEKVMRDIESKYAPKKWGVYVGGALTAGAAASAIMLPALAPVLGITVPAIALAAGAVGAAIGYGKEKAGEMVERQTAKKSLLGILAIARPR